MTQTSTLRMTWLDRLRAEPAAAAALAIFVASTATIVGAWYFEFVLRLPPCPLCLEERLPYHVVIPLSLLMAIAALARAPHKLLTVGFIAIIAIVACGAVLGEMAAVWKKKSATFCVPQCTKKKRNPNSASARNWRPYSPTLVLMNQFKNYEALKSSRLLSKNDHSRHKRCVRVHAAFTKSEGRRMARQPASIITVDNVHHDFRDSTWVADYAQQ